MSPRSQYRHTNRSPTSRLVLLLLFGLSMLLHIRLYSINNYHQAERPSDERQSSSSSSTIIRSTLSNNQTAVWRENKVNGTITRLSPAMNSSMLGQEAPLQKIGKDDVAFAISTTKRLGGEEPADPARSFLLDQRANDSMAMLPEPWMQDYISWHQEQTQSFHNNDSVVTDDYDWSQHRYLIVRCLHRDVSCGGLADRLRSLPFLLLVASKSKRLLLFYWERPAPLEAFFEPVTMNWRIPSPLVQLLTKPQTNTTLWKFPRVVRNSMISDVETLLQSSNIFEDFRSQAYSEAAKYYENAAVTTSSTTTRQSSASSLSSRTKMTLMDEHVGPLWRALFRPIPRIRQAIKNEWQRHGLVPGAYIAVHARTLYAADLSMKQSTFTSLIENSIHCARTLFPLLSQYHHQQNGGNVTTTTNVAHPSNHKIYFASDSRQAKDRAVLYGQGQVVTDTRRRQQNAKTSDNESNTNSDDNEQDALHFDRGAAFLIPNNHTTVLMKNSQQLTAVGAGATTSMLSNDAEAVAIAYHSVIQDLYLLASARCVAYDRGGFGNLAALLSLDPACQLNHKKKTCPKG